MDIRETDFTDDRLTIVLWHLSDKQRWQAIEQELGEHLVRVYELEEQPMRVDATTVSDYRDGGEDSLWQFGHSKDDPTLRQIKAMMATLDPLSLPLAQGYEVSRTCVGRTQLAGTPAGGAFLRLCRHPAPSPDRRRLEKAQTATIR